MVNGSTLDTWLAEIRKALKPGGVLGIEEHRAKRRRRPGRELEEGLRAGEVAHRHVEAAGFKLAGKSEINANPKDTKDYPEGVWALPPTLRARRQGQATKYMAIGESDRMTLKFTKAPDGWTPPKK